MKTGRIFATCACVALAATLFCATGEKSTKTSSGKSDGIKGTAEGRAYVFDDDTALARDKAIEDARMRLVETVLGTQVQSKTVMENFQIAKHVVEAKAFGLVKNDRVIAEARQGDTYILTIEGIVCPSAIEDAISDVLSRYGKPKFLVLVQEDFEGSKTQPGSTHTEASMQQMMGGMGFTFVDGQTVKTLMTNERAKMTRAMSGQVGADVQSLLLESVGAEVIITGTTISRDQTDALRKVNEQLAGTSMQSKRATVQLKAIDVYTGNILGTMTDSQPALHIDKDTGSRNAVDKCLAKIIGTQDPQSGKFTMGPFCKEVVMKFVQSATNRQISLFITGLDVAGLDRLRNLLKERVRNVQSVEVRGQAGKAAKLDVYYAGKTEEFTYELGKKAEKLGFTIVIKERYPNRVLMEATLIKKQ